MPDADGNTTADEQTIPETPLHAYKEGREEDLDGDVEKLTSGDPKQLQVSEVQQGDDSEKSTEPDKS